MVIIWLIFIGIVLQLGTILLSRQVESNDGSNALVSYLSSIVSMVLNISKIFIIFLIALIIVNLF